MKDIGEITVCFIYFILLFLVLQLIARKDPNYKKKNLHFSGSWFMMAQEPHLFEMYAIL